MAEEAKGRRAPKFITQSQRETTASAPSSQPALPLPSETITAGVPTDPCLGVACVFRVLATMAGQVEGRTPRTWT